MPPNRRVQISKGTQVARLGSEQPAAEDAGLGGRRPSAERIITLPVTQIYPDPDQPRAPLLPLDTRQRFYLREIDCFQAVTEWRQAARKDAGHMARIKFLEDLANGMKAEEGGQINPITVVRMAEDGYYLIETGEQRYWAAVLGYVLGGMKGPVPELRVSVREHLSRYRQVIENRHIGPPSAISQAREIAALLQIEAGFEIPAEVLGDSQARRDPYAIARWVAGQRLPHGKADQIWENLKGVMGVSSRMMRYLLDTLRMPTELLQMADRHDVPERILREILGYESDLWATLLEDAILHGWSSEEVQSTAPPEKTPAERSARTRPAIRQDDLVSRKALSGVRRFLRTLAGNQAHSQAALGFVADELAIANDAVDHYRRLADLTEQVRLRLIARGELEE